MLVDAEERGLENGWRTAWRIPRLASVIQLLATIAAASGAVYLAWTSATSIAQTTAITIIGLVAISGLASLASRGTQAAVTDRLNVLRRALDTAADAQIIAASNGQALYANTAFQRMFPGNGSPLDRIERSLVVDAEALSKFRQLRNRVSAGVRGQETLSLPDLCSGAVGRFRLAANPIAGGSGCSFWSIRDITARDKAETMLRAERDKLVDFFDNAPIGFYSVDSSGRFRFINRTLAQWLNATPSELLKTGARLHRFSSFGAARRNGSLGPVRRPEQPNASGRSNAQNPTGPRAACLDWAKHCWVGCRTVHAISRLRPDAGARVEGRAQIITTVSSASLPTRQWAAPYSTGPAVLRRRTARSASCSAFEPKDLIGQKLVGLVNEEDRPGIAAGSPRRRRGERSANRSRSGSARPREKNHGVVPQPDRRW